MAGGYMARQMGLPLRRLCAGVNANDVTHRVVSTGRMERAPTMLKTLSEAINIQLVRRRMMMMMKTMHEWEPVSC